MSDITGANSTSSSIGREINISDIRTNDGTYYVPTYSCLARREGEHWTCLSGKWLDENTYEVVNATPTTFSRVRRLVRPDDEEQALIAAAYTSYHLNQR